MAAWTNPLGARLLESLPAENVARLSSACGLAIGGDSALPRWRRELLARAAQSPALQRDIRRAWRGAHAEVVAATQLVHLSVAGAAAQCQSLTAQFSPEDVLLELLTDEHDDGWQLARELVDELRGDPLGQRFGDLLERWSNEARTQKLARVVIFGGHPRDESRLRPRFEAGPFELRWRVCERRQGDSVDRSLVTDALSSADGAIIVTGMASHTIMELARGLAKARGLPWRCVEKASEGQLAAALEEMFPGLGPSR
jgi:hypothetical protein